MELTGTVSATGFTTRLSPSIRGLRCLFLGSVVELVDTRGYVSSLPVAYDIRVKLQGMIRSFKVRSVA